MVCGLAQTHIHSNLGFSWRLFALVGVGWGFGFSCGERWALLFRFALFNLLWSEILVPLFKGDLAAFLFGGFPRIRKRQDRGILGLSLHREDFLNRLVVNHPAWGGVDVLGHEFTCFGFADAAVFIEFGDGTVQSFDRL
jgi:hypothetical protein